MNSAVYAVLLACLYGSSFAAPVGNPTDQLAGTLGGATNNLVPSLAKKDIVDGLTRGIPVVGGQKRGLVDGLPIAGSVGDLTRTLPLAGARKRGLVDGLPALGSAGDLTKGLPLSGDNSKRDIEIPIIGRIGRLGGRDHIERSLDVLPMLGLAERPPKVDGGAKRYTDLPSANFDQMLKPVDDFANGPALENLTNKLSLLGRTRGSNDDEDDEIDVDVSN